MTIKSCGIYLAIFSIVGIGISQFSPADAACFIPGTNTRCPNEAQPISIDLDRPVAAPAPTSSMVIPLDGTSWNFRSAAEATPVNKPFTFDNGSSSERGTWARLGDGRVKRLNLHVDQIVPKRPANLPSGVARAPSTMNIPRTPPPSPGPYQTVPRYTTPISSASNSILGSILSGFMIGK